MSKVPLRARALDPTKSLSIYTGNELPDLSEYAACNRTISQLPTGVDKDEEMELHLQQALSAQQASSTGNVVAEQAVIPIPEVSDCVQVYHNLYKTDYKPPKQLIKVQAALNLEPELPGYDLDDEDELFLGRLRKEQETMENSVSISDDDFEKIMDRLETNTDYTVIKVDEAKRYLTEFDDDIIATVYDYWLNKRVQSKKPLIAKVKSERRGDGNHHQNSHSNHHNNQHQNNNNNNNNVDPYIAFRRRAERMQTRKNRKNDEDSYGKILKLANDIRKTVTLLEMVKRRARTKRELLNMDAEILDRRFRLDDWSRVHYGSIMKSVYGSSYTTANSVVHATNKAHHQPSTQQQNNHLHPHRNNGKLSAKSGSGILLLDEIDEMAPMLLVPTSKSSGFTPSPGSTNNRSNKQQQQDHHRNNNNHHHRRKFGHLNNHQHRNINNNNNNSRHSQNYHQISTTSTSAVDRGLVSREWLAQNAQDWYYRTNNNNNNANNNNNTSSSFFDPTETTLTSGKSSPFSSTSTLSSSSDPTRKSSSFITGILTSSESRINNNNKKRKFPGGLPSSSSSAPSPPDGRYTFRRLQGCVYYSTDSSRLTWSARYRSKFQQPHPLPSSSSTHRDRATSSTSTPARPATSFSSSKPSTSSKPSSIKVNETDDSSWRGSCGIIGEDPIGEGRSVSGDFVPLLLPTNSSRPEPDGRNEEHFVGYARARRGRGGRLVFDRLPHQYHNKAANSPEKSADSTTSLSLTPFSTTSSNNNININLNVPPQQQQQYPSNDLKPPCTTFSIPFTRTTIPSATLENPKKQSRPPSSQTTHKIFNEIKYFRPRRDAEKETVGLPDDWMDTNDDDADPSSSVINNNSNRPSSSFINNPQLSSSTSDSFVNNGRTMSSRQDRQDNNHKESTIINNINSTTKQSSKSDSNNNNRWSSSSPTTTTTTTTATAENGAFSISSQKYNNNNSNNNNNTSLQQKQQSSSSFLDYFGLIHDGSAFSLSSLSSSSSSWETKIPPYSPLINPELSELLIGGKSDCDARGDAHDGRQPTAKRPKRRKPFVLIGKENGLLEYQPIQVGIEWSSFGMHRNSICLQRLEADAARHQHSVGSLNERIEPVKLCDSFRDHIQIVSKDNAVKTTDAVMDLEAVKSLIEDQEKCDKQTAVNNEENERHRRSASSSFDHQKTEDDDPEDNKHVSSIVSPVIKEDATEEDDEVSGYCSKAATAGTLIQKQQQQQQSQPPAMPVDNDLEEKPSAVNNCEPREPERQITDEKEAQMSVIPKNVKNTEKSIISSVTTIPGNNNNNQHSNNNGMIGSLQHHQLTFPLPTPSPSPTHQHQSSMLIVDNSTVGSTIINNTGSRSDRTERSKMDGDGPAEIDVVQAAEKKLCSTEIITTSTNTTTTTTTTTEQLNDHHRLNNNNLHLEDHDHHHNNQHVAVASLSTMAISPPESVTATSSLTSTTPKPTAPSTGPESHSSTVAETVASVAAGENTATNPSSTTKDYHLHNMNNYNPRSEIK